MLGMALTDLAPREMQEHVIEGWAMHMDLAYRQVDDLDEPGNLGLPVFSEDDECFVSLHRSEARVGEAGCGHGVVRRSELNRVGSHEALEFVWRVEGDDRALVDDGDAVGVLGLIHVMGGEEDRDPLVAAEPEDVLPHERPGLWVEADRRLVKEQYGRGVQHPPGDLESAGHAAREGGDQVAPAVLEGHQAQHTIDPFVDLGAGDVVEDGVETQVLLGGQLVVKGLFLKDDPDAAPHRLGLALHVEATDARLPASRPGESAQHLDRGGLARPVGTEKGKDLAAGDGERHLLHCFDLAVALGKTRHFDRET